VALRTANPGEAPLEPATTEKLLHGTNDNRAQRPRARLEAFFVTTDIAVEVVFKELIQRRSFGVPGPVLRRRFGYQAAAGVLPRQGSGVDDATADDGVPAAGHDGLTSPGGCFEAAHRDLTAQRVK